MVKLKAFREFTAEEIRGILGELSSDLSEEIDFEAFLRVGFLCLLISLSPSLSLGVDKWIIAALASKEVLKLKVV